MAGDWIKMRGNLWDDPRVSKLCDLTDQGEAAVIGGLYWLWATADQHSEDGMMPGLTIRQIDRKTGITGLGAALMDISWIAENENGIEIIRFEEHNGSSAKKRCQTAKRVAKHKSGNAEVTQPPLPDQENDVSGALPREREEKEIKKDCADAQSKKQLSEPGMASPPTGVITFTDHPEEQSRPAHPKANRFKAPRFKAPTLPELIEAFTGKVPNPAHEANSFLNHYESVGWRVGKNPMKSWPHAVNNWISRRSEYATRQPGYQPGQSKSERSEQAFYEYIGSLDESEPESVGQRLGSASLPPPGSRAGREH